MADRGRHAADLAIASFADRHPQPGGRHVFAKPDGNGPIRDIDLVGQPVNLRGTGAAVVQANALAQAFECIMVGDALDLNEIGLGVLEARISQVVRQQSVVCEKEQALAITIEPAGRIDSLDGDEVFERRSTGGVGELTQDVIGLEKGDGAVSAGRCRVV